MTPLQFPLQFTFKITTLSHDFIVQDANGATVCFTRQKLLRLTEHVEVFRDDISKEVLYTMKADRWLDFSATYAMTNHLGAQLGKIARKGWSSLWRANYVLLDAYNQEDMWVQEENAWIKVADGLLNDIPVIGLLSGYFFNPSYVVKRQDGTPLVRLKKEPSFWGRKFTVTKLGEMNPDEEERMLLGLMMMVLLERRRG